MAIITGAAQIDISRDALMFLIHFWLIMLMAEDTLKNGIIRRIDVAVGASIPLSFVFPGIDGEIQGIVIPGGLVPVRGIVAHLASCGESRRHVIGIGGIVIIILVAGIAVGGSAGVPVGMAVDTLQIQMRPGQRKLGLVVVKRCR